MIDIKAPAMCLVSPSLFLFNVENQPIGQEAWRVLNNKYNLFASLTARNCIRCDKGNSFPKLERRPTNESQLGTCRRFDGGKHVVDKPHLAVRTSTLALLASDATS